MVYTRVDMDSRWLGRLDGELVVYKIMFIYEAGKGENWHVTGYLVMLEETGLGKVVDFDVFQKQIQLKRLINIGDNTKEQWVEMSKAS